MREELEREKVHQAIDRTLSGLTGDPWLYNKISAAGKEETKVKRKVSVGLVLAIVLALLATAALAAVLLSHQEIMEQVAVPLASLSREMLEEALQKAVEAEDYEKASQLRDELLRRKKDNDSEKS